MFGLPLLRFALARPVTLAAQPTTEQCTAGRDQALWPLVSFTAAREPISRCRVLIPSAASQDPSTQRESCVPLFHRKLAGSQDRIGLDHSLKSVQGRSHQATTTGMESPEPFEQRQSVPASAASRSENSLRHEVPT